MNAKNIIKAENSPSNGINRRSAIIKNPILAAHEEARRILREAEETAQAMREEARAEAEALHQKTFAEANEAALSELENLLLDAHEKRDTVLREVEKDMLRLAVKLAEKIVGREIKRDKTAIAEMISTALQNARQQERITVRVNPTDLLLLQENIERFSTGGRTRFIDFVADPRVSTSGCIIESEVGTVDARLETQLRILERALLSQSEGEAAEK